MLRVVQHHYTTVMLKVAQSDICIQSLYYQN